MVTRSLAALVTAGALLLTSGCGTGTSPADDVPALATSLDDVDEAIAAGEYDAAGTAVAELSDAATRARRAGDLDAGDAERIAAAAAALLEALPGAEQPQPDPVPDSPSSSAPTEDEGSEESDDENEDEDEESTPAPPDNDDKGDKGDKGDKEKGPKGPKEGKGPKGKG